MDDLLQQCVARSEAVAEIVMGAGVIADAGAVVRRHFPREGALVVADEKGFAAAGEALVAALEAGGLTVSRHVIPAAPRPKPTVELGRSIAGAIGDAVPVALGSGVINDVTKFAAFSQKMPYMCVATAASMDGYASAGAPLSDGGFKKTIPTRAPLAILADLDVIAAAPAEMSAWGFGDTAGKVPAGGDWRIADALRLEPIDDVAWPLVQGNLAKWLSDGPGVKAGEPGAIAELFTALTLSGLAMEFHGSSRPASGADHQIAHMWEMEGLEYGGERVSHGACVSVGAVTALKLYDFIIAQDLATIDRDAVVHWALSFEDKCAEMDEIMAPQLAERAAEETRAKHLEPAHHVGRLANIAQVWPSLRESLRENLPRADEMAATLRGAGAPVAPEDIGVSADYLRRTIRAARFIRSRYTVLDLIDECGLLSEAIDAAVPVAVA